MTLSPFLLRLLRLAAVAALPILRDAALTGVERWARRARERSGFDEGDPWGSDPAGDGAPFGEAGRHAPGFLIARRSGAGSEAPRPLSWLREQRYDDEREEAFDDAGTLPASAAPIDGGSPPSAMVANPGDAPADPAPPSSDFAARVAHPDNLLRAWRHVRRRAGGTPGTDGQTIAAFEASGEGELRRLADEIASCRYRPRPLRCFLKRKASGRHREIGVPTVRDRVAQTAMRQELELAVDPLLTPWSFAYREGRGCHEALDEVDRLLGRGLGWIVRADVADCFDRIPHAPLLDEMVVRLGARGDETAKRLVGAAISGPRRLGRRLTFPRCGVPQGSPLSPLLANLYLDPVDRAMREAGYAHLRYADDLLVACPGPGAAGEALALLGRLLEARGLALNPSKSAVLDASAEAGFDFLGFRYAGGVWCPLPDRVERLRSKVAAHLREAGQGGRHRAEACLRGWAGYFGRRRGGLEVSVEGSRPPGIAGARPENGKSGTDTEAAAP